MRCEFDCAWVANALLIGAIWTTSACKGTDRDATENSSASVHVADNSSAAVASPLLDLRCHRPGEGPVNIGTAFVVRKNQPTTGHYLAITAAHVIEELKLSNCESVDLVAQRVGNEESGLCRYDYDNKNVIPAAARDNVSFPLDLASIKFSLSNPDDTSCAPRQVIKMLLTLPDDALSGQFSVAQRGADGGDTFTGIGTDWLGLELESGIAEGAQGLTMKVISKKGYIAGGYSGSPVFVGNSPNLDRLEAVGILTEQVPVITPVDRHKSVYGFVQRVGDVMWLPNTGVREALAIVPPSTAARRFLSLANKCRLPPNRSKEMLVSRDVFDQAWIIKSLKFDTKYCTQQESSELLSALRGRMVKQYGQMITATWPAFSYIPNGMKYSQITAIKGDEGRRPPLDGCANGRFDEGQHPRGRYEIISLRSYAISAAYQLFPNDLDVGQKQAKQTIRDLSTCESWLGHYRRNPDLILQNMLLSANLTGVDAADIRWYGDLFSKVIGPNYVRAVIKPDDIAQRRVSAIAFRLFDMLYRSNPLLRTNEWSNVVEAARNVAKQEDDESRALSNMWSKDPKTFEANFRTFMIQNNLINDGENWSQAYTTNEKDEYLLSAIERTIERVANFDKRDSAYKANAADGGLRRFRYRMNGGFFRDRFPSM